MQGSQDCRLTKRHFLSVVASVFDPLGLISPVVVACKLVLQKIWRSKLRWDDLLPADIAEEAGKLLKDLANINAFTFPRQVIFDGAALYVFFRRFHKSLRCSCICI